jgi:hypothetical protein
MAKKNANITSWNYYNKAISIGIFIKPINIEDIIFDHKLGVGAKFGSSEESDLIASLINIGYKGYYNSKQFIYHDLYQIKPNKSRYYNYGMGFGALYKKEIIERKKYYIIIKYLIIF